MSYSLLCSSALSNEERKNIVRKFKSNQRKREIYNKYNEHYLQLEPEKKKQRYSLMDRAKKEELLETCAKQYLRNRKHVPCFYRVIQTRVEVWENEECCGNTSRRRVFPQLFRVLPNFHECLYNSIETRSTCFLFLLENTTTRKRKTTC